MLPELLKKNIKETINGLKNKEFSCKELVECHIAQAEKNSSFNTYITKTFDQAITLAELSDKNIKNGNIRNLEGIPVAIKDNYCTKNVKTTAASKMLSNFVPKYESTVTQKLIDSGSISIGKTNMDEFAMGSTNKTSYYGSCINPWKKSNSNEKMVPGGSSGGSAVSVACFDSKASLGTDTGGSVRQPASYTGVVGVKPTYGRCSRNGIIAFASSLDQAGVFARSVEDAAYILKEIMGYDKNDSTSLNVKVPNLIDAINSPGKDIKIGVPKEILEHDGIHQDIKNNLQDTIKIYEEEGALIHKISLKHAKYALPTYYTIAPAEASSNLARYDGIRFGFRDNNEELNLADMYTSSRTRGFGKEVKRRIMIGTNVLCSGFMDAYYIKAQKVRRLIYNDFKNAFQELDAILLPTAPTTSFEINKEEHNPIEVYLNDLLTIPASLAGMPCISIPSGFSSLGMPIGMQIITNSLDEYNLFKISSLLEKNLNYNFIPNNL